MPFSSKDHAVKEFLRLKKWRTSRNELWIKNPENKEVKDRTEKKKVNSFQELIHDLHHLIPQRILQSRLRQARRVDIKAQVKYKICKMD